MTHVSFAEYQEAKNEIISGIEYKEHSTFKNDGVISKQYATEENGTFYEVNDNGRIEFWSDKHPESLIYDENEVKTSMLKDLEKFIHERGWEFKTEESLKAAYDRFWKCKHGMLITQDEFVTEAGPHFEELTLRKVHEALTALVESKKLSPSDAYRYAHYKWCLRSAESVIAYQTDTDKWEVNNCDTEITDDEAKVAVNGEWGFEVSRIKIIGTPYYDATDYQFIRFDCAHMTWLWKNGNLYQVYA